MNAIDLLSQATGLTTRGINLALGQTANDGFQVRQALFAALDRGH